MNDNTKNNNEELSPESQVLIVDDSTQYASVLHKILSNGFGFKNITRVESTESAYELLSKNPEQFKLLFVDYNFPSGVTGGDLLTKLKETHLMDGKVAFLITSEPTPDNVKQAVMAGAFGIVAKPFDRTELGRQLERVKRAIDSSKVESF